MNMYLHLNPAWHKHTKIYTKSGLQSFFIVFFDNLSVLQLAAQVLDEFDDEEIGVGLLDAKLDKAVAKKLGNRSLQGPDSTANHCLQ